MALIKTAKPFSSQEYNKRKPLTGLKDIMSGSMKDQDAASESDEVPADNEQEEMGYTAVEDSLDEAESAIKSGDTQSALDAIASAREHLANCKSTDNESEQNTEAIA